ncbi:MAG: hypothetical protein H8E05_01400 [Bacteroidetes bacterium]|nr:hypothetical protein [Bacteroidota bacterium]
MNDSYESVEVTVSGFELKVITYSVGLERILVLDRYDDISDLELANIVNYLYEEGFLFKRVPRVELVKKV